MNLWKLIRTLYAQQKTPNRLQDLTPAMIIKKKKASKPKLRAKAAQMRHLIPIVVEIARLFHAHMNSEYSQAIYDLVSRLLDFYVAIGMDEEFDSKTFADIIQDFCLIYKALSVCTEGCQCWYLKPKLHMMQELAFESYDSGNPANYWTYKDEDFVGLIASFGNSKGGPRNVCSFIETVFLRYAAL